MTYAIRNPSPLKQSIYFRFVNDTFRPQKQYVYEFQTFRQSDFVELTLIYKKH